MADVESLSSLKAKRANNNTLWTPVDCLKETVRLIESGEVTCNKLVILALQEDERTLGFEWFSCNISQTETLAATDLLKASVLQKLGY